VCVGKDIILSTTGSNGVWSSNNTSLATVDQSGKVHGVGPGGPTILYTVPGCAQPAQFTITVNAAPNGGTITSLTGTSSVCVGSALFLTSNGDPGGSWVSLQPSIVSIANPSSGLVSGAAQGTATILYLVTNSCGQTASTPFVVTVVPAPVAGTISGFNSTCVNGTLNLATSGDPGGTWSSSNTLVATINSSTGVVTALAPGSTNITYKVTSVDCGQVTSPVFPVTINLPPSLTTTQITSACGAASVDLTTGITSSTSGLSVAFYSDQALSNLISNIVTASGTYYVKVTASGGCTSSASIAVTMRANPALTTTQIISPCGAVSVDLNTGISSSTSGLIVTFYGDAGHNQTISNTVFASGTYYVTVASSNGCTTSGSIPVTMTAGPALTTTQITSACGAASVDLNTGITSSTSGLTVAFFSDAGHLSPISNIVTSSNTYYVTVSTAGGCTTSGSILVTMRANPVLTTTPIVSACDAANVDLNAGITSNTSGLTVTFYADAGHLQTISNTVSASGTYFVGVTSINGCTTSGSIAVTMRTNPVANISVGGPTTICAGSSLLLTSSSTSGNQWYLDGGPINNATGQTYSATLQGSYTVVVTNGGCTSAPSTPVAVIVTPQPTVTANADPNGFISAPGTTTYGCGSNATYTITPAACYHISNVIVDGLPVGPVSGYTFNSLAGNHTINATFAINQYSITANPGLNGSITPSGSSNFNCGATPSYTITPNTGYHITGVFVDGSSVGIVGNYQFSPLGANHTISATFDADAFTITASSDVNGSISPVGPTAVSANGSQTYTITPNGCYRILDVKVDGTSIGAAGTYTFTNVTSNHTIDATFEASPNTITVTQPSNGVISPGTLDVTCGGSQTFNISSGGVNGACYHVVNVTVDGVAQGAMSSYTFNNVNGSSFDHRDVRA
jgi:hypothetical protein